MATYKGDECRMHLIVYRLAWCSWRRKKVLVGDIAKDLKELIEGKCSGHGWDIIDLKIEPDHVHLWVQAFPTTPAAFVVHQCKGIAANRLRKKYPELLKMPSLWTGSYFASTNEDIPPELIQKFMDAQNRR